MPHHNQSWMGQGALHSRAACCELPGRNYDGADPEGFAKVGLLKAPEQVTSTLRTCGDRCASVKGCSFFSFSEKLRSCLLCSMCKVAVSHDTRSYVSFEIVSAASSSALVARHKPQVLMKLAIVLHGKIGDVNPFGISAQKLRAVDDAQASPALLAMCFDALERNVIEPNAKRFRVDVIGHSWSPELGDLIDTLLNRFLVLSAHEPPPPLQHFRCVNASLEHRTCHRAYSHLLGVQRALELKRQAERRRSRRYTAVLLSRWDVLWQRQLEITSLPGWLNAMPLLHGEDAKRVGHQSQRAATFWLPRHCAAMNRRGRGNLRSLVCGGGFTEFTSSPASDACAAVGWRGCRPFHTAPHRTTSHRTAPRDTTPYHTTPYRTMPHSTAQHHTTPHHTAPLNVKPHHTTPYHTHTTPHHSTPLQITPYQTALHQTTSNRSAAQPTTLRFDVVCTPVLLI